MIVVGGEYSLYMIEMFAEFVIYSIILFYLWSILMSPANYNFLKKKDIAYSSM